MCCASLSALVQSACWCTSFLFQSQHFHPLGFDRLARDLSAKATASLKRKALKLKTPLLGGGRRPLTVFGKPTGLTPAARKLASQLRPKAPDTDLQVCSHHIAYNHCGYKLLIELAALLGMSTPLFAFPGRRNRMQGDKIFRACKSFEAPVCAWGNWA